MNNRHHANLPVVDASNGTGCCRTVLYCTSSGSSTKALSRQCNGPISFHYLSARDLFARMFKLLASKVSVSHRSVSAPQNTVRMQNFSKLPANHGVRRRMALVHRRNLFLYLLSSERNLDRSPDKARVGDNRGELAGSASAFPL